MIQKNYREGLDYTYIKIFKEDEFEFKNIFEIDNSNISNYKGINICLFQYSNKNELELKTKKQKGILLNLKNKYVIFHSINNKQDSSDSLLHK